MTRTSNWRWRNVEAMLDEWGHDTRLIETLAKIADTPTDRLPGSSVWADPSGTPLAILRYVQTENYKLVFRVDLGYDFNGLEIVHVTRS